MPHDYLAKAIRLFVKLRGEPTERLSAATRLARTLCGNGDTPAPPARAEDTRSVRLPFHPCL